MKRIKKLTPSILKRIIAEERKKLSLLGMLKENKTKAKEVKASEYGTSLANKVDQLSYLKKRQKEVAKEFKKIYEQRQKIKKSIIKRL